MFVICVLQGIDEYEALDYEKIFTSWSPPTQIKCGDLFIKSSFIYI